MASGLKIFTLLVYKDLIVRKRHWRMFIFLQILVPIALFSLFQALRDYNIHSPVKITNNTFYPIQTKDELMNIDNGLTKLYYLPTNEYTDSIMNNTRHCLGLVSENIQGFSDETKMINTYTLIQAEDPLISVLAVVFENYKEKTIKYKIRHSWKITNDLYQTIMGEHLSTTSTLYYDMIPFTQVQMCVDEALINKTVPGSMSNIKMSIQRMPYPPHIDVDPSDVILREMIATFAVIIFIIPLCIEAKYASQEKSNGVIVLMAMNGVKQLYNLLSWLLTGILFSTLYIIPTIILFKNTFNKDEGVEAYLHYGNPFIFWLVFTANIAHLISFGMHVAAYFSEPRFMVIVLSIMYTAALALHEHLWKAGAFGIIPYFGIIFPNILLYRIFEETNIYENKVTGIRWENFFVPGNTEYGTVGSMGFIFLFSLLGAVIHFTLAVYISAMLPGKYGVRKEPLYFLNCMKKNKISLDEEVGELNYDKIADEDFEPVVGSALTPGIQIRDLKKTYTTCCLRKSQVHAVRGISVDFYKGEITALLGHNGAGKTTLMSILTGVTSQTEGIVFINGKNIAAHLETIRHDLGLCPQENMVFPDLNVFEQIEFIGLLKAQNKTRYQVREDVNILLSKLKLSEKRDVLPKKLSGGQQRRLCLGMALIGDASIIILDEPTSGMDPETRRDTWDVILAELSLDITHCSSLIVSSVQDSLFWPGLHYDRNYADGCPARRIEHTSRTVYTILLHALKNNCGERWFVDLQMTAIRDSYGVLILDYKLRGKKTILISTHNMEEADILGDRIAIMHSGRLKSYGTGMFLKKQYGHGHVEVTLSTKSWCEPGKVINKFDSRTQQLSIESEKIVLSIPYTNSLPQSLDSVEKEKKKLGVTGISVSLITLEQVFLKIAKEDNGKHLNELFTTPLNKIKDNKLYLQSIFALFSKKFTYTKKNLVNLFITVILPLLSVLFIALSYNLPEDRTDIVPLTLDMYRYPRALYSSKDEAIGRMYRDTVKYFGGSVDVVSDTSVTDALLNVSVDNIAKYRNHFIVSADFNSTNNDIIANGFYSGIALHSVPLTVNLLSNSLIKTFAGDKYSIHVSRQQLPNTLATTRLEMPEAESISRTSLFCTFFFITVAFFVSHSWEETSTKVKQLQRMTGVTSVSYWGTMFIFDFLIYTVAVLLIVLAFYLMDIILDIRLYHRIEIMSTVLLLELFGINALIMVYIFSFLKKSKAAIIITLGLAPLGLVIVQYVLHILLQSLDNLKLLYIIQKRIFLLIPYVSMYHGNIAFLNIAAQNARCRRLPNRLHDITCIIGDRCCDLDCADGVCRNQMPYFKDFKDDGNFEECILYLGLTPILYFTILIFLEEKLLPLLLMKAKKPQLRVGCETMDDLVKKEKHVVALEINKVNNKSTNIQLQDLKETVSNRSNEMLQSPISEGDSLFLVYELSKYYGKVRAVKEISFRVKSQECFGLLGVNGAGKSTTFRMLTGEEFPNSGIMYLGRANIHSNRKQYLSEIGYCPQTDALIPSLNTFDHLRLFARLRGIPKTNVELEVNKWINRLNLTACMSQPSNTYSGGNKRRLNIAMALIGNPTLVLLDEPTTGVDPAARRSLWNTLQSCQAGGQAIILTSHSMEECEALCNRLVIMVNGQLVCIGACQELKQRFGAGYDIHIKLNPSRTDEEAESIKNIILSTLTCDIRDENLSLLAFHVTDCDTTWVKMYSTMNDVKQRYNCIEDFTVLSATLEQLFIQFAKGAEKLQPTKSSDNVASHDEAV